jgi:CubicO group peptidase (beta-lactamase class C family)
MAFARITTAATAAALIALSTAAAAKEIPTAPPENEGFSAARLARLDAKTHSYVDQGKTAGVITLIARHGRIVHFDVYGKADIEAGTPLKADSLFRMYSMTKPVTTTALLMLYEEGRFQLNDPLEKFLPELKDQKVYVSGVGTQMEVEPAKRRPTMQDVMRHTAGYTYGSQRSPIEKAWQDANVMKDGLQGLVPNIAKLPLVYQPGARWVYSVSHDVQAVLVERISGQKFEDFVAQRIFNPLDMKDSTLGIPAHDLARFTTSYRIDDQGKLAVADKPATSTYKGVGGGSSLTSSARDYLRFAQMLANGGELFGTRLLSPETVKLMRSNHLPDGVWVGANNATGYGLGVSVLVDPVKRANLGSKGEWGWSGAATTHFIIDPEKDIVGIFLTQKFPDDRLYYNEFITMTYQAVTE